MNERAKKAYISLLTVVTLICILIGTFRFFSFRGGNVGRRKGEEAGLEEFSTLTVSVSAADVIVEKGHSYQVELSEGRELSYVVKDGELIISETRKGLLHTERSGHAVITVPSGAELSSVTISTDYGNITLDGVGTETASLQTSAGNITIKDSEVSTASIVSNMGNITLNDTVFVSVNAAADLGNITADLNTEPEDCSLSLKTDLGEIKVDGDKKGREYQTEQNGGSQFTAVSNLGNIKVGF